MQGIGAAIGLGGGLLGMGLGAASLPNGPGISPLMDKISGAQQQQAYNEQANWLGQEGTYALKTSLLQAAQNDYATQRTIGTQAAQYAASGVQSSGSPLSVLTETRVLGNQTSDMIRQQGKLQFNLDNAEALQAIRQGNYAYFSGQAQSMQDIYNYKLQKAQAFDSMLTGAIGSIGQGLYSFGATGAGKAASNWFTSPFKS